MTTDQTSEWVISSWQDLEEIGAGDGAPTEYERCGKHGTPRQQFEHMGATICYICGNERVDELRSEGKRLYPIASGFNSHTNKGHTAGVELSPLWHRLFGIKRNDHSFATQFPASRRPGRIQEIRWPSHLLGCAVGASGPLHLSRPVRKMSTLPRLPMSSYTKSTYS